MIYKFKSKAAGDVILLPANGDQFLRILGREPAAQGIVEPADMPAAIAALRAAVADDERQGRRTDAGGGEGDGPDAGEGPAGRGVTLRQRMWPMIELLERAHAAGHPVVWGV